MSVFRTSGLVVALGLGSIGMGSSAAQQTTPVQQPQQTAQQTVMEQRDETMRRALPDFLTPYHKNYVLPFSMDGDLSEIPSTTPGGENQDTEFKFQVSLRTLIGKEFCNTGAYFAYTALSHWQIYDFDGSAPFRTTDHQPELFLEYLPGRFGCRAGVAHQSNGEGGAESRGWNRVYVEGLWGGVQCFDPAATSRWGVSLKLWNAFDVEDNNEDIEDYLGHFELHGDWLTPLDDLAPVFERSLLSCTLRENFDHQRGWVELDYSLPIWGSLRFLTQYTGGYGESLLEYNQYSNRISFGFDFSP